jgi:endonuclease/exonuclease/phosphatase (EEP) superfamily protein YafD
LIPPSAPAGNGPRIRVATFNLHYSFSAPQVAGMIAAIHAAQADVVMLQELSAPAAAAIQQHLARDYPYQALAPSATYTGMGLISRYPLDVREPQQGIIMQMALLRMSNRSITLINVSLTRPEIKMRRLPVVRWVHVIRAYRTSKRSREIARLLRTIDDTRGPLLVGGDFNLSDREPDYIETNAAIGCIMTCGGASQRCTEATTAFWEYVRQCVQSDKMTR